MTAVVIFALDEKNKIVFVGNVPVNTNIVFRGLLGQNNKSDNSNDSQKIIKTIA